MNKDNKIKLNKDIEKELSKSVSRSFVKAYANAKSLIERMILASKELKNNKKLKATFKKIGASVASLSLTCLMLSSCILGTQTGPSVNGVTDDTVGGSQEVSDTSTPQGDGGISENEITAQEITEETLGIAEPETTDEVTTEDTTAEVTTEDTTAEVTTEETTAEVTTDETTEEITEEVTTEETTEEVTTEETTEVLENINEDDIIKALQAKSDAFYKSNKVRDEKFIPKYTGVARVEVVGKIAYLKMEAIYNNESVIVEVVIENSKMMEKTTEKLLEAIENGKITMKVNEIQNLVEADNGGMTL